MLKPITRFKNCFGFIAVLMLIFFVSCEDAMEKNYKYQRPEWLVGKVYDVAKETPELSTFTKALEKTGLDELINSSGLYTILAPSNEAFDNYFSTHPAYNNIDDIDSASLKRLIQYHIVIMPYSKEQIRSLNTAGWISDNDDEPKYNSFKRETLLRPENKKVKVDINSGGDITLDPNGKSELVIYSGTNKYAPFFFSEHMEYNTIASNDYTFYFDRSFEPTEVFYGGGKLTNITDNEGNTTEAYPAENGYVYVIDQVIDVMGNAYDHLFNDNALTPSYDNFGALVNEFASLSYNEEATYAQEGADEGQAVDLLFNLEYPTLAFDLLNEATHSDPKNSIAYHNALFAPTNAAYDNFLSSVVLRGDNRYFNMEFLPNTIKRSIVNAHMTHWSPYYPSQSGSEGSIYDYNGDRVDLSGIGIEEKDFGSNATFVGIDKVIMPGYFNSVAGPVALRRTYNSFFWAMSFSGALSLTSNESVEYTLFSIPDEKLIGDSTLFVTVTDNKTDYPDGSFKVYDKSDEKMLNLPYYSSSDHFSLRGFVYGQIALGTPKNNCTREYLRNLLGYYTIIDHSDNSVSGGLLSTGGYNGGNALTLKLDNELKEDYGIYGLAPVNGHTYSIEGWLNFPKKYFTGDAFKTYVNNVYVNSKFLDLLERVGMVSAGKFTFLSESEALTVFQPSDAAIIASQIDTLPDDELEKVLKNHFVSGINLFTDNINKNPTPTNYYTKNNSRLLLGSSEANKIDIMYQDGRLFYAVEDQEGRTNQMYLGYDNANENDGDTYEGKILSGIATVIHQIDTVIPAAIVLD